MKNLKTLLLLLAFVSSAAFADGVDTMVAQCEAVMVCKDCQVANDKSSPGAQKALTYRDDRGVAHVRMVPIKDYDWFREPGYAKSKSGHFLMCDRVREAMKKPDSVRALGARAEFSATWNGKPYCFVPPAKVTK